MEKGIKQRRDRGQRRSSLYLKESDGSPLVDIELFQDGGHPKEARDEVSKWAITTEMMK